MDVHWRRGDLIPSQSYAEFVHDLLLKTATIHPQTRAALQMEKPPTVFWSVLKNGKLALLNFSNHDTRIRLADGRLVTLPSYEIALE